jgi:hypothetical protein
VGGERAEIPEVRGNTLRVYLHVLKHGPCELREVQHGLALSSPSLASYHLNRLIEAGYVTQEGSGKYIALKDATSEFLAGYSKIGATIVPQSFFFSLFFTMLVAFFGFEALYTPAFVMYLVVISSAAVAVLWYETVRLWRRFATWK